VIGSTVMHTIEEVLKYYIPGIHPTGSWDNDLKVKIKNNVSNDKFYYYNLLDKEPETPLLNVQNYYNIYIKHTKYKARKIHLRKFLLSFRGLEDKDFFKIKTTKEVFVRKRNRLALFCIKRMDFLTNDINKLFLEAAAYNGVSCYLSKTLFKTQRVMESEDLPKATIIKEANSSYYELMDKINNVSLIPNQSLNPSLIIQNDNNSEVIKNMEQKIMRLEMRLNELTRVRKYNREVQKILNILPINLTSYNYQYFKGLMKRVHYLVITFDYEFETKPNLTILSTLKPKLTNILDPIKTFFDTITWVDDLTMVKSKNFIQQGYECDQSSKSIKDHYLCKVDIQVSDIEILDEFSLYVLARQAEIKKKEDAVKAEEQRIKDLITKIKSDSAASLAPVKAALKALKKPGIKNFLTVYPYDIKYYEFVIKRLMVLNKVKVTSQFMAPYEVVMAQVDDIDVKYQGEIPKSLIKLLKLYKYGNV